MALGAGVGLSRGKSREPQRAGGALIRPARPPACCALSLPARNQAPSSRVCSPIGGPGVVDRALDPQHSDSHPGRASGMSAGQVPMASHMACRSRRCADARTPALAVIVVQSSTLALEG